MRTLWVTLEVYGFSKLLMLWTSPSYLPLSRRFTLLLRYVNLLFLGLYLLSMLARDLGNVVYFGKISVKLPLSIVCLRLFWVILMNAFRVRISWVVGLLVCLELRGLKNVWTPVT